MKSDLYTKAVLTIIAACLVCIVSRDVGFPPSLRAQEEAQIQRKPVTDVNIVQIDGKKFFQTDVSQFHPALPVQ